MNSECAKKIIKILLAADEGCICCASELIKLFVEKFPECRNLLIKIDFLYNFYYNIILTSEK